MAIRKIVMIDEEKCDGCGLCVPACAEGAIQIIDGKARLVSEVFCDGLGACLGECPNDAITIEEREAEEFDERAVETHLQDEKEKVLAHVREAEKSSHAECGCPSARVVTFEREKEPANSAERQVPVSQLAHWPIQLRLTPAGAPFFKDADLIVVADCVPFAYADFHEDLLKGNAVVIGCPKLDDINFYVDRLTDIFKNSDVRSVKVVHMEVPCCSGLTWATEKALTASGKKIPFSEVTIGTKGAKIGS